MRLNRTAVRYFAYVLEILVFFIIQGVPSFIPEVLGGKPVLLIPVALTLAVFEKERAAMIFGLVCGMMIDLGNGAGVGFYTFMLTIICFFEGYAFENLLNRNIFGALLAAFVFVPLLTGGDFVLCFLLKGFDGGAEYFLNHYVSRIVYTFLTTPFFYIINSCLNNSLY